MKEKKKEPNLFVTVFIIGVVVLLVLAFLGVFRSKTPNRKQSTVRLDAARAEILAIPSETAVDEFIKVAKVELSGDSILCRIYIDLKFVPDNYEQVEDWTTGTCKRVLAILRENGVHKNITVWGRRQLEGGKVTLYGRTYYTAGIYEFKNAEELKLK